MAQRNRTILKGWFKTGAYPTAQQFADAWDSFFNLLEDQLSIAAIEGLSAALAEKADYEGLNAHVGNYDNPHQVTAEQVGLGELPNATSDDLETNSSDVLATTKAIYKLFQLVTGSGPTIVDLAADGNITVPIGRLLQSIVIISSAPQSIRIGASADADDYGSWSLAAGSNIVNLQVYADNDTNLYFSGLTAPLTLKVYTL